MVDIEDYILEEGRERDYLAKEEESLKDDFWTAIVDGNDEFGEPKKWQSKYLKWIDENSGEMGIHIKDHDPFDFVENYVSSFEGQDDFEEFKKEKL